MTDVVMPRLSDTMQEGTILRWLKDDGDDVARGEDLVEIETDKASMVYESDLAGTLEILAAEGETLPVGEVIAHIGAANGAAAERPVHQAAPAGEPLGAATELGGAKPVAPLSSAVGPAPAAAAAAGAGGRVKASPLARRLARERGVDLQGVTGSGPGGRIVRADVPAAGEAGAAAAPSRITEPLVSAPAAVGPAEVPLGAGGAPPPTGPPNQVVATAKGATTEVELTRTQQTIARRMAESKATIPDFSLQVEVDMGACVALREELVRVSRNSDGADASVAPTYNDMVVKACALALREQPRVNASYRDGRVQLHGRVNVGVAVAADDALIVPTVFDADTKALGEIARETRRLVARVRSGEITPPELGGGTFTVSNLGMLGATSFTAIINPPQAAILTVGALQRRAVERDDGAAGPGGQGPAGGGPVAPPNPVAPPIEMHSMLTLTLICDHRVLYGADAARFAARVRELLQAPAALTL
jgi:pyruvate dehydrogenase E2 component (dihydrolipoamide acetyltransferase)